MTVPLKVEINWDSVLSEIPDFEKSEVKKLLEEHYIYENDDFPLLTSGHPVVVVNRVIRFKENKIIKYLCDVNKLDLNELAVQYANKMIPLEDYMQIYRMLGYSLCGFVEVFGHKWDEIHHPEKFEEERI